MDITDGVLEKSVQEPRRISHWRKKSLKYSGAIVVDMAQGGLPLNYETMGTVVIASEYANS